MIVSLSVVASQIVCITERWSPDDGTEFNKIENRAVLGVIKAANKMTIRIDNAVLTSDDSYYYMADPVITDLQPRRGIIR